MKMYVLRILRGKVESSVYILSSCGNVKQERQPTKIYGMPEIASASLSHRKLDADTYKWHK